MGTSGRNAPVEAPSAEWQTYQPGDFLRISVPANWEQVRGGNTVMFVPDGGYVRADNGQSACMENAPCSCGDMCWEHCAFMRDPDNDEAATWNDRHCEHVIGYVCEWDEPPP